MAGHSFRRNAYNPRYHMKITGKLPLLKCIVLIHRIKKEKVIINLFIFC